jgi:hypothetical protein
MATVDAMAPVNAPMGSMMEGSSGMLGMNPMMPMIPPLMTMNPMMQPYPMHMNMPMVDPMMEMPPELLAAEEANRNAMKEALKKELREELKKEILSELMKDPWEDLTDKEREALQKAEQDELDKQREALKKEIREELRATPEQDEQRREALKKELRDELKETPEEADAKKEVLKSELREELKQELMPREEEKAQEDKNAPDVNVVPIIAPIGTGDDAVEEEEPIEIEDPLLRSEWEVTCPNCSRKLKTKVGSIYHRCPKCDKVFELQREEVAVEGENKLRNKSEAEKKNENN